jgi:hypothetical protein
MGKVNARDRLANALSEEARQKAQWPPCEYVRTPLDMLKDPDLSDAAKVVGSVLFQCLREGLEETGLSDEEIGQQTGRSPRSARQALLELAREGYIARLHRADDRGRYRVIVPMLRLKGVGPGAAAQGGGPAKVRQTFGEVSPEVRRKSARPLAKFRQTPLLDVLERDKKNNNNNNRQPESSLSSSSRSQETQTPDHGELDASDWRLDPDKPRVIEVIRSRVEIGPQIGPWIEWLVGQYSWPWVKQVILGITKPRRPDRRIVDPIRWVEKTLSSMKAAGNGPSPSGSYSVRSHHGN